MRPVDPRVAVLASGAGSNLQALLDDGYIGQRVALVVSDKPEAGALERARARGIRAVALLPSHYGTRPEYDHALATLLEEEAIGYVLLAGFMRILGPPVIRAFSERILNVHPSLLPAFPGAHAPRDALEWGAKVSGVIPLNTGGFATGYVHHIAWAFGGGIEHWFSDSMAVRVSADAIHTSFYDSSLAIRGQYDLRTMWSVAYYFGRQKRGRL